MMHRAFVNRDWIDSLLTNHKQPLPAEASVRFISVVRVGPKEKVAVFDGCGREVVGLLSPKSTAKSAFFSEYSLRNESPHKPQIILIQACIEERKISETIKRGCEYGVDRFFIVDAHRSEAFSFNKLQKNSDRLGRIAQDACRQSGRLYVPDIVFGTIDCAIKQLHHQKKCGVFGVVDDHRRLSTVLKENNEAIDYFVVAVGPEGGFSVDECEILKKAGFLGVTWSPYTLRSELAGLAAIAIAHAFYGRA